MTPSPKSIVGNTLLMASFALLVTACSSSGSKAGSDMERALVENARVNVDWPGTYQGMLPCSAACDGIATMIVLYPDNHFKLRTRKMGIDIKDKIEEGRVIWQEGGSELILVGDDPLSAAINRIRVNRDSLSVYQQQPTAGVESAKIELEKTGSVPIPPPTI